MDRQRRTAKYNAAASSHYSNDQPIGFRSSEEAPVTIKRQAAFHHQQGYRPQNEKPGNKSGNGYSQYKIVYTMLLIVLLGIFIFSVFKLTIYLVQTVKARQEEQMITELIVENEPMLPTNTVELQTDHAVIAGTALTAESSPSITHPVFTEITPAPTNSQIQKPKPDVLIAFAKPLSINPDTVGQLKVGESINTYVVQRDNVYYLTHSFSGEYSFSGAIFLDISCSIYPRSRNLIIHGHNMKNGTAFGKLLRYERIEYLNQYPIIYFSTLYEADNYIPFAVVHYSIDTESDIYLDLYQVNYLSDQEFMKFITKVKAMSLFHLPVNVSRTDEIITLTTCATEDPNMRFAVFAVKNKRTAIR